MLPDLRVRQRDYLLELARLITEEPDLAAARARVDRPGVSPPLHPIPRAASMGLLPGVGLPMIARGEVVGVVFVFRSYPGVFSADDRALLQSFADQAAIALSNAGLYTQVTQQTQYL